MVLLFMYKFTQDRTAVFSITIDNMDCAEAGYLLDKEFGIMTRTGIHCSP